MGRKTQEIKINKIREKEVIKGVKDKRESRKLKEEKRNQRGKTESE